MCQLLGVSSNKNVNINFSLREFKHRGESNHHGWGFAFLENNDWKIIKEPYSLKNEDITQEKFRFKSKIIIGHVRLASCGEKIHKNTHPFIIENRVFAHNGTVKDVKNDKNFFLVNLKPEGDTDSEYAFCYLLEKIKLNPSEEIQIIKNEADKIKKYGKFNFLMSDGKMLYAYGDDSLYYVQRKSPFESVRLKDDQYEVNLSEIKDPDEEAVIIATEPLTVNENWIKISGLKIFKDGKLYSEIA